MPTTGVNLDGVFIFTKNGALFDPSVDPVLEYSVLPDGSTITPVALTRLSQGIWGATVFDFTIVILTGMYYASAHTLDDTVDSTSVLVTWDVT